jgi:8-oxo-dGTP diphosphatase
MKKFNVRVYGLLIADGKVLVSDEVIKGMKVLKFPGGGLEFGEGTIDCLKREFMEELSLEIEVLHHFYTTDFFQVSAFNDNSQIISIYYVVKSLSPLDEMKNNIEGEYSLWLDIHDINDHTFTLGIDKVVGNMLKKTYANE